jgi:hypothetical protein
VSFAGGVGATALLNNVRLVPVPPGPVTTIRPVLTPDGVVAEIVESETTLKDALLPSNVTAVAPVK